jgi:hypothetical protein
MLRAGFLTASFLVAAAGTAAAATYVPGTEDIPLMRGLDTATDASLVFDKPQGRIVEATAQGHVTRSQVEAFYAASLPQLGWQPAGDRRFARDGERLSLDFGGKDGNLLVDFTLAPQQ